MAVLTNLLTGTTAYPNAPDAASAVSKLSEEQLEAVTGALISVFISSDPTITKEDLQKAAVDIMGKVFAP